MLTALFFLFLLFCVLAAIVAGLYSLSPIVCAVVVGIPVVVLAWKGLLREAQSNCKVVEEPSPDAIDCSSWATFKLTWYRALSKLFASTIMLVLVLVVPLSIGEFYGTGKRVLIQHIQNYSQEVVNPFHANEEVEEDSDEELFQELMKREPVAI